MNERIVTIAACLKNQGYATGQFGKNHLGDRNDMLPTNHGFDEFLGNLYHLNAEEEPEQPSRTLRAACGDALRASWTAAARDSVGARKISVVEV